LSTLDEQVLADPRTHTSDPDASEDRAAEGLSVEEGPGLQRFRMTRWPRLRAASGVGVIGLLIYGLTAGENWIVVLVQVPLILGTSLRAPWSSATFAANATDPKSDAEVMLGADITAFLGAVLAGCRSRKPRWPTAV
jgi:hypothetical protein